MDNFYTGTNKDPRGFPEEFHPNKALTAAGILKKAGEIAQNMQISSAKTVEALHKTLRTRPSVEPEGNDAVLRHLEMNMREAAATADVA